MTEMIESMRLVLTVTHNEQPLVCIGFSSLATRNCWRCHIITATNVWECWRSL